MCGGSLNYFLTRQHTGISKEWPSAIWCAESNTLNVMTKSQKCWESTLDWALHLAWSSMEVVELLLRITASIKLLTCLTDSFAGKTQNSFNSSCPRHQKQAAIDLMQWHSGDQQLHFLFTTLDREVLDAQVKQAHSCLHSVHQLWILLPNKDFVIILLSIDSNSRSN